MTFRASMQLGFALGTVGALLLGNLHAAIFTIPAAVCVVSAACLLHMMFGASPRR